VAKDLLKRTLAAAEGAAMGTSTTVKHTFVCGTYPILRNLHLARIAHRNLEKVGGVILSDEEKGYVKELNRNGGGIGEVDFSRFESVVPFREQLSSAGGGADDTGDVSQVVPLCRIETATCSIPPHKWAFACISGTTIGTKSMMIAAKTIYLTFVELYKSPKKLKEIRDEWESVQGKDYKHECLIGNAPPALEYFYNKAKKSQK
jgi:aminobenzoyl-glutamate utilization protein B